MVEVVSFIFLFKSHRCCKDSPVSRFSFLYKTGLFSFPQRKRKTNNNNLYINFKMFLSPVFLFDCRLSCWRRLAAIGGTRKHFRILSYSRVFSFSFSNVQSCYNLPSTVGFKYDVTGHHTS